MPRYVSKKLRLEFKRREITRAIKIMKKHVSYETPDAVTILCAPHFKFEILIPETIISDTIITSVSLYCHCFLSLHFMSQK